MNDQHQTAGRHNAASVKKRWIGSVIVTAMVLIAMVAVVAGFNQAKPAPASAAPGLASASAAAATPKAGVTPSTSSPTEIAKSPASSSQAPRERVSSSPVTSAPLPVAKTNPPSVPTVPSTETDQHLAAVDQAVAAPVKLSATSALAKGMTAKVTGITAVQGTAQGIGEIAGPAIRFTVTVSNGTKEALSLVNSVVNVTAGSKELPASPLSGPKVTPFPEKVAPGSSASGTFVFLVPSVLRDHVSIYLNYSTAAPIAAFVGSAPKA